MRLPSESQLSREQKEVIAAPTEGTMLVTGPPGSGKTVVAMLRERALKKRRKPVTSVVFNNVLTRYTGNELTFQTWLNEWWRAATGLYYPTSNGVDANGRRRWSQDHAKAIELAFGEKNAVLKERGHWGHLILDEAQDFPPEAHRLLFQVQQKVFGSLDEDERPSLCLLADENQRITSTHSTIRQIKQAHAFLTEAEEYELKQNYRNTQPIASFAAHFYVGLPTGVPRLPSTKGDKPRVFVADLDAAVDRVATYARNHPNEEVGVLVNQQRTRRKCFNKLKHRLGSTSIVVQTYTSERDDEHNDASKLVFNQPGVVTVICFASAKGLEFDAVFLPELQTISIQGGERDMIRMNLYVMCSRARTQLLLGIDDRTRTHEVWKLLPPRDLWMEE
jgi:superfamily I DNA/RNA helicase